MLEFTPAEFFERTGWEFKPEGACKGDVCVPLSRPVARPDGTVDVETFAADMGMPLVADLTYSVQALGPRAGGHVLQSEVAPDLTLEGFDGKAFELASLRGRKVLLLAWASW
jgi:hypothetical protein